MVKPSHILGINARNQLYTSLNSYKSKRFGFSKLRAKNFLQKHGIQVAKLYAKIQTREQLRQFDWNTIEGSFVLKPANGSAGKGILVIKRKDRKRNIFIDITGKEWSQKDLQLHVGDILQGAYATWGKQHTALIEERVPVHPDLEKYVEIGTPDLRIIVFNKIPVMSEFRIPTKESQGKANLHQGAIGLGVDLGTGETTYGISGNNKIIKVFPHTEISVSGIPIPYWVDLLKTAVRAANATDFMYVGVDLFIHPQKGPMVTELNGFPGLAIQIANKAGLKKRLERVEEIEARSVSHAVRIGQALFAESYAISGSDIGELVVISPKTTIVVYDEQDHGHEIDGLINTGRFRSAIAFNVAKNLGLLNATDHLWNQEIEGEGRVPVIEVKFKLKDRIITTTMVVSKGLENKSSSVEIGRKDLHGFLVGDIQ